MPETDTDVSVPDLERVGKYDVVEWIADGGFATLYKGRDPFLKRAVAIKVCTSGDGDLRQQFLREAEIAGRLDHPNIVRTFDFGFEGGRPYLVQEYLHGEDLWQKIERRAPLSPRHRLGLALQIAQGLAYSHEMGVLHLDVKPANVRVVEQGQAKILDFGIARLAHGETGPGLEGMAGTAGYLPPEQIRGEALDSRADIFAFGALVYELFTYRRPYRGETVEELIKQVLSGRAEPITTHWPDCPAALAGIVHRCLERDREARYSRFDELLPELLELLRSLPAEAGDPGWTADPVLAGSLPGTEKARAALPPVPQDPALAPASVVGTAESETEVVSPPDADGPPLPAARVPRQPGRVVRWLVAAAVAIFASAGGLWLVRGVDRAEATPKEVEVPALETAETSPGVLLVSAVPWGEVLRVSEAERGDVALPASRITPLRLRLAPGRYHVELSGPRGAESWTCDARVAPGATHICHAELASVSVTSYFKELGWWQ